MNIKDIISFPKNTIQIIKNYPNVLKENEMLKKAVGDPVKFDVPAGINQTFVNTNAVLALFTILLELA